MSENREIRFIDQHYNELFTIPDGGSIVVTHPDGNQYIGVCKYLDATHFDMNGSCYHQMQFTEMLERRGAKVEPEKEPEIVSGYRVIRRIPVNNKIFVMAHNPKAVQPFVTWQGHKDYPGYGWGHYWPDRSIAGTDLRHRANAERTGKSYDHTELIPKERDKDYER